MKKKKVVIKNWLTARDFVPAPPQADSDGVLLGQYGPSLCQPSMGITIREIINAHSRGTLANMPQFKPVWNGDVDIPDINRLNPLDKLDYLHQLTEFTREEEARLKAEVERVKEFSKKLKEKEGEFKDVIVDVEEEVSLKAKEPEKKE